MPTIENAAKAIFPKTAAAAKPGKISDYELKESRLALKTLAYRSLKKDRDAYLFVKYEWPELVITDKEELADFRANINRKDWLDIRIDDFQVDMIKTAIGGKHSQQFVSGGTKLGKGFTAGGLETNIWYTMFQDSKCILIGPNVTHVQNNLFAETVTWRKKMTSYKDGSEKVECLVDRMRDPNNEKHFVIIINPDSPEGFSGLHSPHPFFCFDESSSQPDTRYTDALSQCATGMLVCIGNPRQPSGFFYRAFKGFETGCKTTKSEAGPRRLISVGLVDCINVRANRISGLFSPPGGIEVEGFHVPEGEAIPTHLLSKTKLLIPGQGCLMAVQTLKKTCPPDEIEWRVFGRFPKDAKAFQLFQQSWWEESNEKHKRLGSKILARALGLDVASSERGDYCALAWGDHQGCLDIDLIQNPNLVMLKGEIYHRATMRGLDLTSGLVPVAIDCMAMGAGLADTMEMDGVHIIRIGGGADHNKEIYFNRRAEVYGELANAVNPQTYLKETWAMPDDDMLREELFALERIYVNAAKFKLNSKRKMDNVLKQRNQDGRDSVEEKIGRSPDRADAVGYLYQAIRELPEFFDFVTDQFNPSRYLRECKDLGGGEFLVTFWDGKFDKLTKEALTERFGDPPRILNYGS